MICLHTYTYGQTLRQDEYFQGIALAKQSRDRFGRKRRYRRGRRPAPATGGAAVVIYYNTRREAAEMLESELADMGRKAITAAGHLSRPDYVSKLFDEAVAAFSGVDIVVANAGVSAAPASFADVSDDVIERVLRGNTQATLFMLRAAARHVRDQGRIILIGSSTTAQSSRRLRRLRRKQGAGSAIDADPRGRTRRPRHHGQHGVGRPDRYGLADSFTAEQKDALAKASPFGRLGTAQDTADIVAFLAGDDARWRSGQILVANGAASV